LKSAYQRVQYQVFTGALLITAGMRTGMGCPHCNSCICKQGYSAARAEFAVWLVVIPSFKDITPPLILTYLLLCMCRFAHEGILNCARAIRDDLRSLGLLEQLLLGTADSTQQQQQGPGSSTGGQASKNTAAAAAFPSADGSVDAAAANGSNAGAAGPAAAAAAAAAAQAARELPDCRGWTLVLTGHSLGVLLGLAINLLAAACMV
jgi:hypothetical protein